MLMRGLKPRRAWHNYAVLDHLSKTPQKSPLVCSVRHLLWYTARGATQFASAPHGKVTLKLCVPQMRTRCRSAFFGMDWRRYERQRRIAVESGATMTCNVRIV